MPKMISDPDDASAGRKFKKGERGMPEELGSAIRVDGKPLKQDRSISGGMPPLVGDGEGIKPKLMRALARDEANRADIADRATRTNAMGDTYKKGGMTASKRADGIAQKGKTRGTMIMCGGGMARGKK